MKGWQRGCGLGNNGSLNGSCAECGVCDYTHSSGNVNAIRLLKTAKPSKRAYKWFTTHTHNGPPATLS